MSTPEVKTRSKFWSGYGIAKTDACVKFTSGTRLFRKVFDDLCYTSDHILHIPIPHRMKHRQADEPLVSIFGHRKLSAFVAKAIAIIRMKMNRNVMNVHADVFPPERPENFTSVGAQFAQIKTDGIQVPGGINFRPHRRAQNCGNFAEGRRVSRRDLSSSR